jgi:hypothetical protein
MRRGLWMGYFLLISRLILVTLEVDAITSTTGRKP